jgi:hypothetical protein
MTNKYKILIIALVIVLVVPQIIMAVWWNPMTWTLWGKIWSFFFHNQNNNSNSDNDSIVCPMYCAENMLCGSDGKDYCNDCLAKASGAIIVHEGRCANAPIVGGDRDAHSCIGSAGYSWCDPKQKCLRVWEENCQISADVYPTYSDLKWNNTSAEVEIMNEPVTGTAINGYKITATGKINVSADARKFFGYYDSKLKSLGWSVDNNLSADGVLGSQTGYKNGNNYIVLSYDIKVGKVTSGPSEPLQYTCPCGVTYSIFTGSSAK